MATDILIGEAIRGKVQPSPQYQSGRVCENDECGTKLSIYNSNNFCNTHVPTKFPRVRGYSKHFVEIMK